MTDTDEAASPTPTKRDDAMTLISKQLSLPRPAGLSTGDHATIRRMFLTGKPAAEGVVVKLLHLAGLDRQQYDQDFSAWKLLVHIAALLSGTGRLQAHKAWRGLGAALQEAGVSENRLMRLTSARGSALRDQLVLAGRVLAQAGNGPVDLWDIFHLASRDPKTVEQARIQIARDYYSAEARSEGDKK